MSLSIPNANIGQEHISARLDHRREQSIIYSAMAVTSHGETLFLLKTRVSHAVLL